ncbi:MAG: histidine kinase [Actinomycetaceae bacterium]|nr:histidine kinase [Actinomycetaceae bacterium]
MASQSTLYPRTTRPLFAVRILLCIGCGVMTWINWFASFICGLLCLPLLPWVAYLGAHINYQLATTYLSATGLAGQTPSSVMSLSRKVGFSPTFSPPDSVWLLSDSNSQSLRLLKHWITTSLLLVFSTAITAFITVVAPAWMCTIFGLDIIHDAPTSLLLTVSVLLCGCLYACAVTTLLLVTARPLYHLAPLPFPAEEIHAKRTLGRRIVEAFEIERQRIERDLHDGAQQFLVASNMKIGEALMLVEYGSLNDVKQLLEQAQHANDEALAALRCTVNGVHPQVLSDRGLAEAVAEVVSDSPVDTRLVIPHPLPHIPAGVATAAYFLVCEALTNIAKYAPDSHATVLLAASQDLVVSIIDDGPGGAQIHPGHGLSGLSARLEAFGGELSVNSPPGGPTEIRGRLPLLLITGESALSIDNSSLSDSNSPDTFHHFAPHPHAELNLAEAGATAPHVNKDHYPTTILENQ